MSDFEHALAALPLRIANFVREYVKDGNGKQAALRAGYAPSCAKTRAWQLLKDERVKTAVAAARTAIAERTCYDADQAMAELQDGMQFAKQTNNATALARMIELRARITGVLIDRQEIDLGANINLAAIVAERDAKRAGRLIEHEEDQTERLARLLS